MSATRFVDVSEYDECFEVDGELIRVIAVVAVSDRHLTLEDAWFYPVSAAPAFLGVRGTLRIFRLISKEAREDGFLSCSADGFRSGGATPKRIDSLDKEIAMKSYPAPPIPQEIADRMEALVRADVPQQEVIWAMRQEGLHIMECMKLIHLFFGVSRNEAKEIVHFSDAWASMRPAYDAFHDMAEAALEEMKRQDAEETSLQNAS